MVLLNIYPREMKTSAHIKNLYINVHSGFIHNSPKLETIQMPIPQ